jgi:hypothetical protein
MATSVATPQCMDDVSRLDDDDETTTKVLGTLFSSLLAFDIKLRHQPVNHGCDFGDDSGIDVAGRVQAIEEEDVEAALEDSKILLRLESVLVALREHIVSDLGSKGATDRAVLPCPARTGCRDEVVCDVLEDLRWQVEERHGALIRARSTGGSGDFGLVEVDVWI